MTDGGSCCSVVLVFVLRKVVGGEPLKLQLRYEYQLSISCDQLKTRRQKPPADGPGEVTQNREADVGGVNCSFVLFVITNPIPFAEKNNDTQ